MGPPSNDLPISAKARLWGDLAKPYIVAALVLACIAAMFGVVGIARQRHNDAFFSQPMKHGAATVTAVTMVPSGKSSFMVPPIYHVEVGGKGATIQTLSGARVGDTVRITYREDQQGNILVQSIDEVVASKR